MKRFNIFVVTVLISVISAFPTAYNVSVSASGNSSALLTKIGFSNLDDVTTLTVSGTLNGYDYMAIRNKLPNLKELDLSATSIIANDFPYYSTYTVTEEEFPASLFVSCGITDKIESIKLPQNITKIGNSAFSGCSKLTSVIFSSNVREIGESAFNNCTSLKVMQLPNTVETINQYAFQYCTNLETINFPNELVSIGNLAFWKCSKLTNVEFSGALNTISKEAFKDCTSITQIELSNRVSVLENGAFSNCSSLESVTLPSSLTSIGSSAFSGCTSIRKVYAYSVQPVTLPLNAFPSGIFDVCTLYVPRAGYNAYYWDSNWSQFATMVASDFTYENLYVSGEDYILNNETGVFLGNPEIAVMTKSGIIIKDAISQNSKEVILMSDGKDAGSVIATDNLTATSLTMQMSVAKDKWYFFAVPYNTTLSNVRCRGNWVIRTYSGRNRANTGNGWVNLGSGETTIQRKHGYIFQSDTDGILFITMSSPSFTTEDVVEELNMYDATEAANSSWNFLGNPFPTYYALSDLDISTPVTVRNVTKNIYEAYSSEDDAYHLAPFQPFFIQKPSGVNKITFKSDKRRTYEMSLNLEYLSAPALRSVASTRKLIDVELCNEAGEMFDHTRVVFNDQREYGYDMGADASKFFSEEAFAELYSMEGNCAYSINERPLSGDVVLAYRASESGDYKLRATRADICVQLYDHETNTFVTLDEKGYSFHTEAGSFPQRFTLAGVVTSIEKLETKHSDPHYYDLSGRPVRLDEQQKTITIESESGQHKLIVR